MSKVELNDGTVDVGSVARVAQESLADRPVIVLGSGASVAHGLPGMPELAKHIVSVLDPETRPEAEQRVWERFKSELSSTNDLERSLSEVPSESPLLRSILASTWTLISERDRVVHDAIVSAAKALPLTRFVQHLLRTSNPHVSIVTTNYDRLAEYAGDLAGVRVVTGFEGTWLQRFDDGVLGHAGGAGARVTIYKPHGSLDWFLDRDGEPRGTPLSTGIPDGCEPLIVTPGVTKYQKTLTDPFRTITAKADEALKKATCFLCVGYGFNDEHIHPVLKRRIRKDKVPIVVLARTLTTAARSVVVDAAVPRFLAIERSGSDATIYSPEQLGGVTVADSAIWDFASFLDLVLGAEGGTRDDL